MYYDILCTVLQLAADLLLERPLVEIQAQGFCDT